MTLKRCIQIICFQTLTFALAAQVPFQHKLADKVTETWRWTRFGELSDLGVRCMAEESNEGLLFGVDEGIMRYSGYDWTMIPFPDSMSGLSITALCIGLDESIWAGTDAGLFVVKNGIWREVFPEVDAGETVVSDIIRLPGGSLLVGLDDGGGGSANSGLIHIDNNSKTLYCSSFTYQKLKKIPGRSYILSIVPESLTIPNVTGSRVFNITDLHVQRDGRVIIAISNKHNKGKISICSFHRGAPGNLKVENVFTEDNGLHIKSNAKVTESQSGELWVVSTASDLGVQLYKNEVWQEIRTGYIFGGQESHNSILACSDGSIWIEGNGSIFVLLNGQWKVYKHPEIPLTSASKYVFHEASDNKIWVLGVLDEIYLFDNTFEKWITYEGLIFQGETSSGESWYLHRNGEVVLNRFGEWLAYGQKDGLMDTPVRIFITSNDEIWALGSHRQIAATAYFKNGNWVLIKHPELSWGIDHRGCFESKDSALWFGCSIDIQKEKGQKGGVLRFMTSDEGNLEWNRLPENENIVIANSYGIGSSKDGRVWIGGRPLWTFYEGTWTKFEGDKKLEEYVDDVDTDKQGNLWLASRYYGIFRFDGESWTNYTTDNGLPSNNIISIFAESDSVVWATTHGGVSLFDGKSWTEVDFLGVMSIVDEGGTIIKGKKGHVWFNNSTNDWYQRAVTKEKTDPIAYERFKTIRYTPDKIPPETSFVTYEKKFIQQEGAYILWEGMDYFNESPSDKLQYSWRLNDNAWTTFSTSKYHIFNGLKSGHYRMEVRSRDMCLNIDPSPATIEFRVLVPWWKHPLFIAMALITIGLISFLQYRVLYNNKKLHQLNDSLENKSEELNNTLTKMERLIYSRLKFFTNISHEFRTPLGLILGPVDELRESNNRINKETRNKYYDIIHRNATRILRLINQILEVYKVEENTLEFRPSRGDIVLQIKGIVDLFDHLANQHGISLKFEHSQEAIVLSYDHDKIEKIIFNLLSNAFRNVPFNGKIKIRADVKEEGNSKMLNIAVSDNGRGILPEEYEKIFERFYHNDSGSYRQLHAGTGIGLAYIKDLVKAHKGSIKVSSTPGVETVFHFEIPFIEFTVTEKKQIDSVEAQSEPPSGDIHKAVAELGSFLTEKNKEIEQDENLQTVKEEKSATILIVEDDTDTRLFIRECLEYKFSILEANDGLEGIHVARVEHPDLIVSDVMMPEQDGIQFCHIVKTDFDTSHIPFILLSAKAKVADKIKGIEIGADAYLEKPFNKKLLLSHIDNLLKSRNQLRKRFKEETELRPSEMKMASLDEQFIEKTIEVIESNIDDVDLDAEQLSIEVGVSRIQLYRKMKALTGQTVSQFIRSIRLKKASMLLKEKDLSVSEIAYMVGFSAPNHFARYFKGYYGTTPTEFRGRY